MTLSVAEKANTPSAGDNRACSNRMSRENKYGNGKGVGIRNRDGFQKRPLYYGDRQRKKLLCL